MFSRGFSLVNSEDWDWKINQLLFVDDTTLAADSEEKLRQLVEKFGRVCRRKNLSEWE